MAAVDFSRFASVLKDLGVAGEVRVLAKYDVVWAAAGHPHAVFPTSFDELVRITGGTSAEVGALFVATKRGGGGAGRAASACAAATFRGDTARPSVVTSQVDCDVARGLWHGYRLHCH
jgi:hypothetical protein